MDMLGEYLADNDRYAFLLGSALRNDDLEQFFCIYDSIVPKDLPEAQVEKIKEQARVIADLPEDEFNQLVLNARDYSLARGRPASLPLPAMSSSDQELFNDQSDEDDSRVLGTRLATNLDLNTSAAAHRLLASGVKDDDSGLPSSTKTGRNNSMSSEDTTEMEEKEQCESAHFCSETLKKDDVDERNEKKTSDAPRRRDLVAVRVAYNPEYDEEVALEHDNESLESPRSDASSTREYDVTQLDGEEGMEMTTFSSEQRGYYDYDSDDNIHSSPYRDPWAFRGRPRDSGVSSINFDLSSKILAEGKSISSLRSTSIASSSVDESVNFSLGGFSTQSRSPDHAGALTSSRRSPSSGTSDQAGALCGSRRSPPFGSGKDLLSKVGESVSSLVSAHDPSKLRKAEEEPKHSKTKQKKENKDDGTREGGNNGKLVTKDVNGNPTETDGSQQMRELQIDDKSCVVSVSGRPGSSGAHNHEMGHTQGEDLGGSQSTGRRSRRNKRNARHQGVDVYPDKDEHYYGAVQDVNSLVKFINNDISAENLKEIEKRESKKPGGNLDDKDRKEMGNTSSSEKQDTKEDEADSPSPRVILVEPETNKKKAKNEITKPESGKSPKNHVVSNKKTSSAAKQGQNNEDKTKAKLQDNLREADAEDTKMKNSKKTKTKAIKKDSQELNKKISLPSPPVIPDAPFDFTGSAQGQWCTVVNQKKKRSQAQTSAVDQNGYTPVVSSSQTRSKDKHTLSSGYPFDPHRRGVQQSVLQHTSVKPQSYVLPSLRTAESERREKDLNPSDFPVLNSSPRDYRRSLENVFDTGALISDKDSDKESSKSFPADAGVVGRCKTSYPVSYASMASGNRTLESADSLKAESVNSSVEDSNGEFSTNSSMPLKWKGSPQERRHSIGSAPKELSKNVLQRTGSQEMLPCDTNLRSPPATIPNKIDSTDSKNLVSSDSTGSFTSSDADSARGSEIGSEGIGEGFTTTAVKTGATSQSGTPVQIKNSGVCAVDTLSKESEKTKSTAKSIPVEPALRSQPVRTETKVSSSGAKPTNNGRKKGVVFFCKKIEDSTPVTGLQFGSFHEEEYASIVTKSALSKSSVPVNSEPEGGDFSSNLSHSSQQPSGTAPTSSNVSSSDHFVKPPKGPHIAGLNGLVSPQTTDINPPLVLQTSVSPLVTAEQTPTQLKSTGPSPPCSVSGSEVCLQGSESSSESTTKLSQDTVRFAYGPKLNKYAVYRRPSEEIPTWDPSEDRTKVAVFLFSSMEESKRTHNNWI